MAPQRRQVNPVAPKGINAWPIDDEGRYDQRNHQGKNSLRRGRLIEGFCANDRFPTADGCYRSTCPDPTHRKDWHAKGKGDRALHSTCRIILRFKCMLQCVTRRNPSRINQLGSGLVVCIELTRTRGHRENIAWTFIAMISVGALGTTPAYASGGGGFLCNLPPVEVPVSARRGGGSGGGTSVPEPASLAIRPLAPALRASRHVVAAARSSKEVLRSRCRWSAALDEAGAFSVLSYPKRRKPDSPTSQLRTSLQRELPGV